MHLNAMGIQEGEMMWKALWQWGITIQVSIYTPLAPNDQQLNCKKSLLGKGEIFALFRNSQ